MKKLYPLKFKPILKNKIWGGDKIHTLLNKREASKLDCGESWEISSVEGDISIVANGFLKGTNLQELIKTYTGNLLGDNVYEKFGDKFPLLIKFIDANDKLSVQVHPDDKMAKERHNSFGKTEMWYVLQTEKNAELISGFSKKVDKKEYSQLVKDKKLKQILNTVKVHPGDTFFIPAGRVHAIGAGIMLAEIQQTSDITYRIYDWDRVDTNGQARELHTNLAIGVVDFNVYDTYKQSYAKNEKKAMLVDCPYFTTHLITLDAKTQMDYVKLDSFVIYISVEGASILRGESFKDITLQQGETILIPATLKNFNIISEEQAKLLEVSYSKIG